MGVYIDKMALLLDLQQPGRIEFAAIPNKVRLRGIRAN